MSSYRTSLGASLTDNFRYIIGVAVRLAVDLGLHYEEGDAEPEAFENDQTDGASRENGA